jgi:hypothetical protein
MIEVTGSDERGAQRMKARTRWAGATAVGVTIALLLTAAAHADEVQRTQRIAFARGKTSAAIDGSVHGYDTIDYKLEASKGQTMSVVLKSKNTSAYFNVIPPNSTDALFIGAVRGDKWSGTLPTTGDYTVHVYLTDDAARRAETAKFTLDVSVTTLPQAP